MSMCVRVSLGALIVLVGCNGATLVEEVKGLANGEFTMTLGERDIHFEVHGSGPVVMAVPNSWGLSLAGLRGMYGPMEEHLTIVYFDPRGMGESGAVVVETDMGLEAVRSDFHAVREHLGLESVNAIGRSNGAMNLILLAAERPETLDSAIFVHGGASFTAEDMKAFSEAHPELARRWGAELVSLQSPELSDEERAARQKEFWLAEYFPAAQANAEKTGAAVRAAFEPAQFSYRHGDYNNRTYPEFDARDRLGGIAVRSLVIAGAADMMPPERVKELADGLADAEFVVFESSGHFSPLEEPERFKSVVLEFLGVAPSAEEAD